MPKNEKKTSLVRKVLKWFIIAFSSAVVFAIGTALVISLFFQDKIKNIIIAELNKQLRSEIKADNIDVSIFRHFPYVSLTFHNMSALDATDHKIKDTLLKAEKLNLNFNIIDILTEDYRLKTIDVENATMKLKIYKDNSDNYTFWETSQDTTDSAFKLELNKIKCKKVKVIYTDLALDQKYNFTINTGTIKGRFDDDIFQAEAYGDLSVRYVKAGEFDFLVGRNAKLNLNLTVDNAKSLYTINEGGLCLGEMCFDIAGIVDNSGVTTMDLGIKGGNIGLTEFIHEWPEPYRSMMTEYQADGSVTIEATVKGSAGGGEVPLVVIKADMKNGTLYYSDENISLNGISFTGFYTNGEGHSSETSRLRLDNFSASLAEGQVSGTFILENFNNPLIKTEGRAALNLSEAARFARISGFSVGSGTMALEFFFNGRSSLAGTFSPEDFINSKCHGKASVRDLYITDKTTGRTYSNINGLFQFNNNDIIIENLSLVSGQSDFSLAGYFRNALSYAFIPGEKLNIDAGLDSRHIVLDDLLTDQSTEADTAFSFEFPGNINWNLDADIAKLTFGKFTATNLYGKVKLKNRIFTADNIFLEAFGGSLTAGGTIDGRVNSSMPVVCKVAVDRTDIRKMFYQLNNFGQNELGDKNIKGTLTASLEIVFAIDNKLSIDLNTLYAFADIVIENGELIDYAPMQELSRFVRVNDLSHIRFETLKNKIEIKNRTIHIPSMQIKSSALNIEALGTHTFDNVIDYRIKLLLSELLGRKAIQSKKENEEFGQVEDDGLGKITLFLKITGTVDNPEVSYDSRGVFDKNKNAVKEDIKSTFDKIGDELFRKNDTIVSGIETEKEKEKKKRKKDNEIPEDFKLE